MRKDYNVGLCVLRAIMCFMVILIHYWDSTETNGILKCISFTKGYAVPIFMIMSFSFVSGTLVIHEKSKICERFERLLIPQIGWAVIYWIVFFVIDRVFNIRFVTGISDLLWQIFTGHSPCLNATMWYQVNLIYLTLLFLVIISVFKKNYLKILCIIGLFALILQYSGINMIFDNLRYELKYPLGRFAEMLPLAVVGFIIGCKDILRRLKAHRGFVSIVSITVILCISRYDIFSEVPGYGYSGVSKILVGVSFISLFYVIPFEKMSEKVIAVITYATQYTLGIYCMHRLVGQLLTAADSGFKLYIMRNHSFIACIIIYILCFICSYIGMRLFGKTKLRALFN